MSQRAIQLVNKHSVVKGKAPSPDHAELGEILLNVHASDPAAYTKTTAGTMHRIGGYTFSAAPPVQVETDANNHVAISVNFASLDVLP